MDTFHGVPIDDPKRFLELTLFRNPVRHPLEGSEALYVSEKKQRLFGGLVLNIQHFLRMSG